MVSGFGDDNAAVGVTNQQDGSILGVDQAIGGGHVIGNRAQRILDRYGVEALGWQSQDDLGPA
jgi:hypothetical protein